MTDRSEWQRPAALIRTRLRRGRAAEIEIEDGERARRGIGRRKPDLGEDGGFDAHGYLSKLKTAGC